MDKWQPVPVAGGAYADDANPFALMDTVNRLVVPAEKPGARSDGMLRDRPGYAVFAVLGTSAPVRGLYNADGLLCAISDNKLFTQSVTGLPTFRGNIPGVGRVVMAHNQIAGGNEIVIATGSTGYVFDTKQTTLTAIADEAFPGAKALDFVDGFIAGVEPQGRFWFISDLAAASQYSTLDRSEAESQPDRIVTLRASHREVVVFGERTTEFFRNAGTATNTFQRIDGTEMEVGCAAAHSVAKLDNSLFWLGSDGSVYRLNGYTPQRISTRPVEQAIGRCYMADAYAYTFEDQGHKLYCLTLPDGHTWVFDVSTNEWVRFESYGLNFWRLSHLVKWRGVWIAGDYANGKLYQLHWKLNTDAGVPKVRSRTFPVTHDSGNRFTVDAIRFDYDTGRIFDGPPLLVQGVGIDGDLGNGAQGDDVTFAYTLSAGVQPVTCAVTSGALPGGLALATDGKITGTRTTQGAFSWIVTATDADGNKVTLADASTTTTAEVYTWRNVSGTIPGQGSNCVFIDGDVICLGLNNNSFTYSLARGAQGSWVVSNAPTAFTPSGLVKYNGAWFMFGQASGTQYAAKALGDSFVWAMLPTPPFTVGQSESSAWVIDGYIYVAETVNAATTFRLRRTIDGANYTIVDTGIVTGAVNSSITGYTKSGAWHVFTCSTGRVIRTQDFATWFTVASLGSGNLSIASVGDTVVVAHTTGSSLYRSTDNGATFGAAIPGVASWIMSNGVHFTGGHAYAVSTSLDGLTWVQRISSTNGAGRRGNGYAARTLQCIGTFGGYAFVGDIQ